MINVGFKQFTSIKCPVNLSNNLYVVLGGGHSTLFLVHNWSQNALNSSLFKSDGNLTPIASSKPEIIGILLKGGVKSISNS